jgi:vanillate O-demethylase ferredoxin subunit
MSNHLIPAVITKKWAEAEGVFCFTLELPGNEILPPVEAGAHIDVEIREGVVRQYSLCQPPGSQHYQIGVLNDPTSRGGSRDLTQSIEVGSVLRISRPRNHFGLVPSARHSILIAGGIGITPILAMAEQLQARGQSFELHYGARSQNSAAFIKRLAQSVIASHIRLAFDDLGQRLDLKEILSDPHPDEHVYVCGPSGLIEAVLATAKAQGWPERSVHREFFGGAVQPTSEGQEIEVTAARSGLTVIVSPDMSVAQALVQAGVDVTTFCEQGVCGSCMTRVIEGVPDHRDQYLSDAEKSAGDQLLLCCSRARTSALILDI